MLYIAQCNEFYKIGVTKNPNTRLSDLQIGNPYKITFVGIYKVPDSFEKKINSFLSNYGKRVRGEWFSLKLDEVIKIQEILSRRERELNE